MPRYFSYRGQPRKYTAYGRMKQSSARAAESRSLGDHLPGAMGDRYLGPVDASQLGPVALPTNRGSLGDIGAMGSLGSVSQRSYFGGQDLGANMFGHQDLGAALLSDNEKRLVALGAIALVGWFVFGKKIKKGFKKNPPRAGQPKMAPSQRKRFMKEISTLVKQGYTRGEAKEEVLHRWGLDPSRISRG